jgi:hypothetical protein
MFLVTVVWGNRPPDIPYNPWPPDGATGVDTFTVIPFGFTFSWDCSDPDGDMLTYMVRYGATPEMSSVYYPLDVPSLWVSIIRGDTHYYWQVTAYDEHGEVTEGPVWTFWTYKAAVIREFHWDKCFGFGGDVDYSFARDECWVDYLTNECGSSEIYGIVGRWCGVSKGISGNPDYWSTEIWGVHTSGVYHLDSKDGYSEAFFTFRTSLTESYEEAYLPFHLGVYIDGVKAGEQLIEISQGERELVQFEFPIDFDAVVVGRGIPVEVRTEEYTTQNSLPIEPPDLNEGESVSYDEDMEVSHPAIILRQ